MWVFKDARHHKQLHPKLHEFWQKTSFAWVLKPGSHHLQYYLHSLNTGYRLWSSPRFEEDTKGISTNSNIKSCSFFLMDCLGNVILAESLPGCSATVTSFPSHEMGLKVPLCTFSIPNRPLYLSAHTLLEIQLPDLPTQCDIWQLGHLSYARWHFCSMSITMDNTVQCNGIELYQNQNFESSLQCTPPV